MFEALARILFPFDHKTIIGCATTRKIPRMIFVRKMILIDVPACIHVTFATQQPVLIAKITNSSLETHALVWYSLQYIGSCYAADMPKNPLCLPRYLVIYNLL